ncbi:acyl-CoA N-acyltransferase [Penicillium odoratum]|uniref:acyl-CoA N-acyltransferase n=1 Tax=Penicillium odoratum TaxID=1167516 RepID=UPI002547BDFF|nr:acyl-CoA N-acyltransferase [Penicillium odoratum]KAJ5752574.1 acyl-CoA N-acyltransferase [Penicillium odoratum]
MIIPPQPSRPGLIIQRATAQDIPSIKSMVNSAYSKYIERIGKPPAPMSANYEEIMKTHDIFVLKDEKINDEIVGSIVLRVERNNHSVQIDNLVVGPAAQGRGYGRVLLECGEDVARSQNCLALTLFTNVKMYENLGMYVKMGFVEIGRRTEDGFERVYFRKDL